MLNRTRLSAVGFRHLPRRRRNRPFLVNGTRRRLEKWRSRIVRGLPATLQNIPVEYFGKAVRWMREPPLVDADFIAVYGTS
jgi:hypothetical protein